MRLQSLELENFRQYAHARVQLDTGITAIVGANGAGKSTLVEAILWALYGARVVREGAKTLRFHWSQGGTKVQVKLEFSLGNQSYRVERTPTDALLAHLQGASWVSIARGTAPVNLSIQQLLGMDERQFQTSFCARQKELEFMRYQPQRRREEISKMLGYERVSKAYDLITNDTRQLNARVDGLKQGIGDPQIFEQQIEQTERTIESLQKETTQLEQLLSQHKQALEQAREECVQHEQKRQSYQELTKTKQVLEARLSEIERRLEEQRKEWDEVQQAKERHKAIKDNVERYSHLVKELRQLDQLAQSERERTRLTTQIDTALQQANQVQQKLDALQQKREEYEALQPELKRVQSLERDLAEIRKAGQQAGRRAQLAERYQQLLQRIQELDRVAEQLAQTETQLTQQRQDLKTHQQVIEAQSQRVREAHDAWMHQRSEARAVLQSLQREHHQQKERYDQLQALGAEGTCPTCGQTLGEGYQQVLEELNAALRNLQTQIQQARQQVEALEKEPESLVALRKELERFQEEGNQLRTREAQLAQQVSQLKTQLSQRSDLQKQAEQTQREIASIPEYDPEQERKLQAQRDSLEPIVQQARTLEIELREAPKLESELKQIQAQIARLQRQLNELPQGYDPVLHKQTRQEVEALTPFYEEYNQLVPILKKKDSLCAQIKATRAEQEEQKRQLEQTEEQIAQLGYDEPAYLRALQAYQVAEQQYKQTEQRYTDLKSQIEAQSRLLQTLQENLNQIRARQQELQEAQKALNLHQVTRQALQDFRSELNTRLQPLLSSYATEFLTALTNGRYTELELNEDFEFFIKDEGIRKEVISGGEEDIVNLSMRLALARLITERAGQPLSLLILDEVFGSLDTDRRRSVMNLLNSLRDWFEQILVISHIEEINDSADRCLYVVRDERTRASTVMERLAADAEGLMEQLLAEDPSEAV